jgi:uncharacterized integral membrane protein (TIGR00697 family)
MIEVHVAGMMVLCTAGALGYPLSFVLQDVLAELEGREVTRAAVFGSMMGAALLVAYSQLTMAVGSGLGLEPLTRTFEATPRIVAGSLAAFLAGGLADVRVFFAVRAVTGEPKLWLRKILSTMVGQAVDSAVFVTVAFAGILPVEVVAPMAVLQWALKIAIAVLSLPVSYAAIAWARR